MNKEKILAVADAIENHTIKDLGFNMSFWWKTTTDPTLDKSGYNCNNIACIAGWTCALETILIPGISYSIETKARNILELD